MVLDKGDQSQSKYKVLPLGPMPPQSLHLSQSPPELYLLWSMCQLAGEARAGAMTPSDLGSGGKGELGNWDEKSQKEGELPQGWGAPLLSFSWVSVMQIGPSSKTCNRFGIRVIAAGVIGQG